MKLFYIDTDYGYQAVMPQDELNERFTKQELDEFKSDENTYFFELNYTMKEYKKAKSLYEDGEWCEWYEDEYMTMPTQLEVLEHLYGRK